MSNTTHIRHGWYRLQGAQGFAHIFCPANRSLREAGYAWVARLYGQCAGNRYDTSIVTYTADGAYCAVPGPTAHPLDLGERVWRKPHAIRRQLVVNRWYFTPDRRLGFVLGTGGNIAFPLVVAQWDHAYPGPTGGTPHFRFEHYDGLGKHESGDSRQRLVWRCMRVPRQALGDLRRTGLHAL